ncbi:hypothetical protein Tco_1120709, partial [Tanacetum coccineum]
MTVSWRGSTITLVFAAMAGSDTGSTHDTVALSENLKSSYFVDESPHRIWCPRHISARRKLYSGNMPRECIKFPTLAKPSSDQILEALHIHPLLTVKGMPECQNHLQSSSSERLDTVALLRKMTPTRAVLYSSMHDQKGKGILEEPTVDWKGSPSTPNEHGGIRAAAFVLGHVADIYMNGTIGQRKELGYATTWHN